MSDGTHIEWTDATWNIITGCSVVSPGCKHCYAMKLAGTRLKHDSTRTGLTIDTAAGPVWNGEVRFNEKWLDQPLRWKRPRKIFVCAHGDLFHESVPDEWIDKVFAVMALAPQHTFQVLTKRAERMRDYIQCGRGSCIRIGIRHQIEHMGRPDIGAVGKALPNVWLGVSVEDQERANQRIPMLLDTPAAVRWLSCEPLLGRVDLCEHLGMWWNQTMGCFESTGQRINVAVDGRPGIGWVVVGGESGNGARPMYPEWAHALRRQCAAACVPFLFKQWGAWAPSENWSDDQVIPSGTLHYLDAKNDDRNAMWLVGKKAAGRLLDGRAHDGYPAP